MSCAVAAVWDATFHPLLALLDTSYRETLQLARRPLLPHLMIYYKDQLNGAAVPKALVPLQQFPAGWTHS